MAWINFESRSYSKSDFHYKIMQSGNKFRGEIFENGKLVFQTQEHEGKSIEEMDEIDKIGASFRMSSGSSFYDPNALSMTKEEIFAFCRPKRKK